MTGLAKPTQSTNLQLQLAWTRTRLAMLIGGLCGIGGVIYIVLYLALIQPDPAFLATASGLVALLVPLAFGLPALATLLSYQRLPEKEISRGWLFWWNRLASTSITGALVGWAVWLLCILIVPTLPVGRVSTPALIAETALCGGLAGAVTAYASAGIGRRGMLVRLSAVVFLGLPLTMLLVTDPAWWYDSLSYMGRGGQAALVFSITMILCGLSLCGVMLEIGRNLRDLSQQGLFPPRAARALSWLLAIGSLGIVGVGLFPSNTDPVSQTLHVVTGNGGLLILLGVMLALRWLAPPFGKTAHLASALIGALTIGVFLLNVLNIINFVWFELIDIAFLITWLFFFESYSSIVLTDQHADT